MNTAYLRGKHIAVTGGSGFVGRHLIPMLLDAGAEVTVICRPSSKTAHLPQTVRFVHADLATGTGLAEAFRDADIVIHMAALLFGLDWQDYLGANCSAARSVSAAFAAAQASGNAPQRLVFVSSLSAAGPCDSSRGKSEDESDFPVSAYGWSKILSENILRAGTGDRLVILRPPIIYGSGDLGMLPVYKGLQKGVAALPGLNRPFPVSVIHADDIARAIMLCCLPEASGIYHVSDGSVYRMADFYRTAAKTLGTKAIIFRIPLWFMGLTATISTVWGQLVRRLRKGRPPNWNNDKFREARQKGWTACADRINNELGFTPQVDLESGLRETMEGNFRLGLMHRKNPASDHSQSR